MIDDYDIDDGLEFVIELIHQKIFKCNREIYWLDQKNIGKALNIIYQIPAINFKTNGTLLVMLMLSYANNFFLLCMNCHGVYDIRLLIRS